MPKIKHESVEKQLVAVDALLTRMMTGSSYGRCAAYPDDEEEHEEDVKDEVDLLTGRVHPANTRFFPVTRSVTTNSGTNVSLQHLAYLDSD